MTPAAPVWQLASSGDQHSAPAAGAIIVAAIPDAHGCELRMPHQTSMVSGSALSAESGIDAEVLQVC